MFCVKYILKNPKYVFYSQSSVVSETFTRGTFLGIEKNKIKNKTKRGCHTKKKEKHTEKWKKIYIKKTFLPFNSPYILLLHESIWTYILLVHSNIAMTKTSRGKSFLSRPLGKNESLAVYLSTLKIKQLCSSLGFKKFCAFHKIRTNWMEKTSGFTWMKHQFWFVLCMLMKKKNTWRKLLISSWKLKIAEELFECVWPFCGTGT